MRFTVIGVLYGCNFEAHTDSESTAYAIAETMTRQYGSAFKVWRGSTELCAGNTVTRDANGGSYVSLTGLR